MSCTERRIGRGTAATKSVKSHLTSSRIKAIASANKTLGHGSASLVQQVWQQMKRGTEMWNSFPSSIVVGALTFAAIAVSLPSSAHAADIPAKAPLPRTVSPAYSWSGFYVGGQVGGGWGDNAGVSANAAGLGPIPWNLKPDGVLGG